MESEWIEYDSAGYPHKRPAPLGNCDSQQSEQPQGEASRRRFGAFIHDSMCAVFMLDNKTQHVCDCGHAVPVQTEGGEKRCPFVDNYRVNPHGCFETDLTDGGDYSPNRWVIHGKTCPRYVESPASQKWHEPGSPPSQPAGGALEFYDSYCESPFDYADIGENFEKIMEFCCQFAEAYAAEQVREAGDWKKVAEERKELADSLVDRVAQLRQERDAARKEIERLRQLITESGLRV